MRDGGRGGTTGDLLKVAIFAAFFFSLKASHLAPLLGDFFLDGGLRTPTFDVKPASADVDGRSAIDEDEAGGGGVRRGNKLWLTCARLCCC